MSECPHCARFRAERDEALEKLRQLREEAPNRALLEAITAKLQMPPTQTQIVALLLKRDVVPRESLYRALYSDRPGDGPDMKVIDVLMVQVRKRLAALDVTLKTAYRRGWYLTEEDKAFLKGVLGEPWSAAT